MKFGPSPDEINSLVTLFSEGRYSEALPLAQTLTVRFPSHQLSWKVVGAILMKTGRMADALPVMQNVAALAQDDANLHNSLGVVFKELGRMSEAETSYLRALQIKPDYAEALSNLGNTQKDLGRLEEAETSYRRALQIKPDLAVAHSNLGNTLKELGRLEEAESSYLRALKLRPNYADAHNNLGNTLKELGRPEEALVSYGSALQINPGYAEAHANSANTLKDLGRLKEAESSYLRAVQLSPTDAVAYNNLGVIQKALGRFAEAKASYGRSLEVNPNYAEAHINLGMILVDMGHLDDAAASYQRALQIAPLNPVWHCNLGTILMYLDCVDEAVASYQRALKIKPDLVDALNNLALAFLGQGKSMLALGAINQSIKIEETALAKGIFVTCIKDARLTHHDDEMQAILVRALTEPWGRPTSIARVCIELIKLRPDIKAWVARATQVWPHRLSAQELFGTDGIAGLATLATDPLLCALLNSALICDVEMEYFLTMARWAMLETVTGLPTSEALATLPLEFCSALARQCFLNEYVFSITDDEALTASDLRDSLVTALEDGSQISVLWPLVVATYFPLCSIPNATRLLDTNWPEAMTVVLQQQVQEPQEERNLRASIPRLTDIDDEVSLLVQNQYEENPYPRWSRIASNDVPATVEVAIRRRFPLASVQHVSQLADPDILIAGCGTGQHSIGTAQRFLRARVLAVDLSMSSLSYAKRKTQELGLTSLEYAQADILKLGSLERRFDVIESAGVLHHLADPWTGWRILVSLLRPGGCMALGFYSEVARRQIVQIRTLIAEHGYGSTTDDIRQCRQDLLSSDKRSEYGTALNLTDFFSVSACRDLLFHVQEHRMNLAAIGEFLSANHLTFLGFEIDLSVLGAYKKRFPNDPAATNLGQWQIFENENPDTFLSMYQFWIQKRN